MSIHVRNNTIRKRCMIAVSAKVEDMGEGAMNDGLSVDPIPGNRNGNDILEDSLE